MYSVVFDLKKKQHHLKQNWIHVNILQYTPAWFLFDIPLENNNLNTCKDNIIADVNGRLKIL